MNFQELHDHIARNIQGVFGFGEMEVLKEEIGKLKPGELYVEVGVDEGRSARVAHEYADPDVYKFYIDIHNVDPHEVSIGRGRWMEQEGMVGIGKKGFFIHGDGDLFAVFLTPVSLCFLDPHHDYESIKSCTLAMEFRMIEGGVMLFHDTDHPDTFKFLNDHFGDKWENLHNKIGRVKL